MLYLLYVQPYSSQIISTQRIGKSSSSIRNANSPLQLLLLQLLLQLLLWRSLTRLDTIEQGFNQLRPMVNKQGDTLNQLANSRTQLASAQAQQGQTLQ